MLIFMAVIIVWFIMGTETYRRLGAIEKKRVETVRKSKHRSYCSMNKYRLDCDCILKYQLQEQLGIAAIKAYCLWPAYLTYYMYANVAKLYCNMRGKDWSFFVEPKMVKSKSERMLSIEQKSKALEKSLKELDREIASL